MKQILHLFLVMLLSIAFSLVTVGQTPTIEQTLPESYFVGEDFCFDIDISNNSPNVGFGPYLRLVLPPELEFQSMEFFGGGSIVLDEVFGGPIEDPLTMEELTGPSGHRLIIFELPVGSVVQGGPSLITEVCLNIDPTSTIGAPIPIDITPVFRFGDTATGDNGPIRGNTLMPEVIPVLYTYEKVVYDFQEERPPGPAWTMDYELIVDIANTGTITDLSFTDVLPNNLQFVEVVGITGSGQNCQVIQEPATDQTGGTLSVECESATGSTNEKDVVVNYRAYIIDVLDHSNCSTQDVINRSEFTTGASPLVDDDDEITIARHVTMQKNAVPIEGKPDDPVRFTVNFQVSDYDEVDGMIITDVVPDGLSLDVNSVALTVGGQSIPGNFNIQQNTPSTGRTTIITNVHNDYFLETGNNLVGPISGSITYNTVIDQQYDINGAHILASDVLNDNAGLVYSTVGGANNCSIQDGAPVNILPVGVRKSLSSSTQSPFQPGDQVTYILELDIPSGDADNVILEDFFPLPILDLVEMGFTPDIGPSGNIRPITGGDFLGVAPDNATIDASTNSLILTFPDVHEANGNKIGVEVDVNVVDKPFADDLFHSNIILAKTNNTESVTAFDVALNLIKVFAPSLVITKGVVETDNPNATVEPNENPINGDAVGVDAGDRITYQTTIFNDGGATAYDVLINDIIPAELSNCTLVSVTQGDGAAPIATTGDLFNGGLMISELPADDGNENSGPDMALVRYTCTCTTEVEPKEEIINTASVTWASQPGATPFAAMTEEAKITIGSPEIFKFVEKIQPRYAGDDTRVQIGDTVYYVVNLIIPEGTNTQVRITDRLATGLGLIAVDEVIAPTGVTTDISGGFDAIAATEPTDGQNIALDFGTITNTNDDNSVEDFITIKYRAEVLNVPYNGQNINTSTGVGRALRNEAKLIYSEDDNEALSARTSVRIVESIVDITKEFTSSNNPNAVIDADGNITEAMAGDMVSYQVTINNTGAGSMIDAKLLDDQDMLRNCVLDGLVDQDGVAIAHTISNDTILFDNPIPGESSVIATYTCEVIPSVNPGQLIDNNATIFYDPTAGQTEPSEASDNATIKIVEPKIEKEKITITPNYSGNLEEVQIGEIVTYTATIDVPRGTSNNVIFEDILDAGLAFIAVDNVTASPNVSTTATGDFAGMPANAVIEAEGNGTVAADRKVTIDMGTLRNTDEDNATIETITIQYRVIVLNTTSNIRGQELNNNANWYWDDPNGATPDAPKLVVSDSEKVTIIEPELQVNTTFTNNQIDLEDETFVILTISHTDASNGDAKDINLVNELPFGLLFIDGSFNTTCPTVPSFTEDTSPASGGTVTASFEDLPLGTECEISYRAKHDPAAAECDDLTNCATVTYESLGDIDQGTLDTPPNNQFGAERTGDINDAGQLNNYQNEGCGELQITNGLTADPFISANTPVCTNGRAVFTNETEYQGSNVVYQWFGPNGEIDNDNFQLIIDPVSMEDAGSYYTIVTVDGCNTEPSNRVNLTVDPLPTTPIASVGNNGVYCAGENVQLFANAENGVDFLWTGPNGYSSTAQNPIIINASTLSSGDYFVEVTNEAGCTSEASNAVNVTINPQPQPLSINNDSPVCTDGSTNVTLSAENVPNGAEVQWYNGDGDLIGTGNNFVLENITVTDAGNYYAILSVNGCASEPSATTEVIVDEIPAEVAFAGDDQNYCTGVENITLAATAPTSGTGMWSVMSENAGAIIVSPMNPATSVTGLQSGTYTFVWTLSNGTCVDYSSDEMTVQIGGNLAAPTATNDGAACEGENIALLAENVPDGASIEWMGPNGYTSNAIDPILENVQAIDAGDYKVRYMTQDGCTSAFSEPTSVEVLEGAEQPTLFTNSPICNGEQLELTATFYNGISSYQWYGPEGGNPTLNTEIPKASVPFFSNAYINGDWRVRITGSNGCVSELSEPITVEIRDNPTAPTATVQQPVCAGSDINLQASPVGNATYNWEGPNTFSSAFQNPVISNADSDDNGTYRVSVTVDGCVSEFSEVIITVADLPTATPTNNGGACGQSLQFFANAADGSGNYAYEWTGPNNFSSTAEKPVIDNPNAANEGSYSLIVTDTDTGCSSEPAVTQVSVVSDQTFQPTISGNDPICAGERLALNTLEISGNSVNYEWTGPNGTSTSNGDFANAPSLIINNVATSDAGDYSVSVTVDGCASTPSDAYTVVVNEQPELAPSSSLTGSTCADGSEDIQLFANPTSNNISSYQWEGPADFTSVAQDPVISNATSDNSGIYTVIATDANGCVSEKQEVNLVINDKPATPVITPITSSVCAGESFVITVPLYDGSVTYNWALDANPIGNNTNSIVIEEATAADAGIYTVSVTINGCTSETANMEVAVSERPVVVLEDQDGGCAAGSGDYTLVATVTGGATPYTYDWSGPNGFTSAAANPVIPNAGSDDAGTYNLTVTDANGCVSERQSAVLTINDQPQQPTFQSTGTVCAGEPLELMIQGYSGTNVTYNWTKDGVDLNNNSNIYFVNPATAADAGTYEVSVAIGNCESETSTLEVNINEGIEVAVDNQDIPCTNGTETLTLTAQITGGNAPFTYAWSGPNGFSSAAAEPSINNVSALNSGTYTLQVTDNQGCTSPANSGVITITNALSEPLITQEGGNCEGEMVTLSVKEYEGNNITYDWLLDGTSLNNDSPVLTINPTTVDDAGNYQVTVTVDGCSINSDIYTLEIEPQPVVMISEVEPLACTDGTTDITLDATAADPDGNYTYSWTGPNDFTSTAEDAIITNADASKSGTYILTMTNANGCASAATSVIVDITDAITQPMISASGAACEGESITLSATNYEGATIEYSWTADGVVLPTTGSELILDPVTVEDDVVYVVEVTVNGCSNISDGFRPTIYPTPTVTVADIPEQTCTDGTKDIILDATPEAAADPLEFAWTGPNGFTASGEDVLLPNAGADDAGTYTVILTDGNGCSSTPASVTISLTDALDQPVIASTGNVCIGDRVVLSIPSYNGANVDYAWERDGVVLGINNNQVVLEPTQPSDRGTYSVTVTVDGCSTTSEDFFLDIFLSPTVEILPISPAATECTSDTDDLVLDAEANGGTGSYRYVWSGPNGFNSTDENPTLFNINAEKSGTYEVYVVDTRNCESAPATIDLDITDAPERPVITSSGPTCLGGRIVLSAQTYSGSDLTYTWSRDGINLNNNSNVLVIDPVQQEDDGIYLLTVGRSGCNTSSQPFQMEFYTPPTLEVPTFPDFECVDGESGLTLSATASGGSGTYRYFWTGPGDFQSNMRLPELDPLTADKAGTYRVYVEDSNGCPSDIMEVQINVTEQIKLPQLLTSGPACIGGDVTFEVEEYEGNDVTYEWFKDDVPLPFTTRTFMLSNVSTQDRGAYQIRVTVDGCTDVSPKYVLEIYDSPNVTLGQPTGTVGCVRGTESYTFDLEVQEGAGPYVFRWSGPNDFRSTLQNPTLNNINSTLSGTYTVLVRDQNQCFADEASVEVSFQDAPDQPVIVSNTQVCIGQATTLEAQSYSGGTVEYFWSFNGEAIDNNSNILNINSVTDDEIGDYSMRVVVDGCESDSDIFTLTAFENPSVTITAPPRFDCTSGTDSYTFEAIIEGGEPPYNFQWTGVNGFSSTLANPTISNLNENSSGTYTLQVTDTNGCTTGSVSTELVITDGLPQPTLTSSGPACPGDDVIFTIPAYEGTNVTYTWTHDGVAIDNNSNQLIVNGVDTENEGTYTVMATVDGCSTTSTSEQLEVLTLPQIVIDPVEPLTCTDGTQDIALNASVTNVDGDLTYAWSGPNDFTSAIEDPVLSNVNASFAGTYTLTVFNSNGCVTAPVSIEIVVDDGLAQPALTTNGPVCAGESVTLSIPPYEGANVTYTWTRDGELIDNNTNLLNINPSTTADAGEYLVMANVDGCETSSNTLDLVIYSLPQVSIAEVAETNCASGTTSIQLDATIVDDNNGLTYSWTGPNGFTSTIEDPVINNATADDAGMYVLQVSNANGCQAQSASVDVVITDGLSQPTITANAPICAGEAAMLSINEYAGNNVLYTWTKNGADLNNNNNTLPINPSTTDDAGEYMVSVIADGCETTSEAYDFVVYDLPQASIVQPEAQACVNDNSSVTLDATPTRGNGFYTYAWTGPNNFTSTQQDPTLVNLSEADAGTYTIVVTDGNGCTAPAVSTVLSITENIPQPVITSSGNACAGAELTLQVREYEGSNVTYEWTRDGALIDNNSNILIINPATADNSGDYQVTVTVGDCTSSSTLRAVQIFESPEAIIEIPPSFSCTDGTQDYTFITTVSGGSGNYTYAWSGPDGFESALANPTIFDVDENNAGTYNLVVSDENNCRSAVASAQLAVDSALEQPFISASNDAICTNGTTTLSIPTYSGTNVAYTWTKDGVDLENNANELIINNITLADTGRYEVMVVVNDCSAISNPYQLRLQPQAVVEIAPVDAINCAAEQDDLQLNATVSNAPGTVTYAWSGPNGFRSTEEDPILNNIDASFAGTYVLEINTGDGCPNVSQSIAIEITDALPQPIISGTGAACEGKSATLSIQDYPANNLNYIWTLNGDTINTTSNELVINPLNNFNAGDYVVEVSNASCKSTSNIYNLRVYSAPSVTIANVAPMNCTSGTNNLTLDATAVGGSGNYTYQWSGPNDYSSTQEDPQIVNIDESKAGTYQVIVNDENGCESASASVVVDITDATPQPVITYSGDVCEGESITLQVDSYEGSNVTYQWTLNGEVIDNNSNVLTVTTATTENSGEYAVRVNSDGCAATSAPQVVQIFANPTLSITTPPTFGCTDGTQDYTFEITVDGSTDGLTYAWTGPNDFTSTLATPTITDLNENKAGTYNLVVTTPSGCNSANTSVELLINDALIQPMITTSNSAICNNGTVTLSIAAYEGTNVSYVWTKDSVDLNNNANQLTINNVNADDTGNYGVSVNVNDCTASATPYELALQPQAIVTIDTIEPVLCASSQQDIQLNATVTNAPGEVTYIWSGPNGFRSTLEDPTLNNINASFAGTYILEVNTGSDCPSVTQSIEIEISEELPQPVITGSGAACAGETAVLEVENYAVAGVSFNWFYNGTDINNTSNRLVINSLNTQNAGEYTVTVSKDDCTTTSAAYILGVFATPNVSIANVAPMNCTSGVNNLTLDATVTGGSGEYSYAWTGPNDYFSAQEDPQIVNINESKSGTYQVIVTDENGCESATASVVVDITDATPQPVIATSGSTCTGGNVTLSVEPYEGANVRYRWSFNGTVIQEGGTELILLNIDNDQAGEYTLEVNSDGCAATSSPVNVEVFDAPQISIGDVAPTFCTAGDTDITLTPNIEGGTAPFTYEWTGPNDFYSVNAEPVLVNANASMDGSYTLRITDGNNCTSNAATIEVDITDAIIQPNIIASKQVCEGEEVTLSVQEYEGVEVRYEWLKDNEPYANVTNNEIIISPVDSTDEGAYQVIVTVDGCSNTSNTYDLATYRKPSASIEIVAPTLCSDGSSDIQLDATATGGNGNYTYLWRGPNNFESTLEDPTIINATNANTGTYTLFISDSNGCGSDVASVEVEISDALTRPVINSTGDACAGEAVTLSVPLYDVPNVQYEWRRDGNLLNTTGNVLTLRPASTVQSGDYTVRIITEECDVVSDAYSLQIFSAPSVDIDPVSPMNCTTGINNLTINATVTGGSGNYTYEWTGPNGYLSTQEDPQIVNINSTKAGTYHLLVRDANGCTSARESVVVDITDGIDTPVIISSGATCEGGQVVLEVAPASGAFINYFWRTPDGVTENIVGINSNRIIINPVDASHLGDYRVDVTANGCRQVSGVYTLETLEQPEASPFTFNTEVCTGDELQLFSNVQGEASDFTYDWEGPAGFVSSLANPIITDAKEVNNGEYQLTISSGTGCSTTEFMTVDNVKPALEQPTISTNLPLCEGQSLVLYTSVNGASFEWIGPLGESESTLQLSGLTTEQNITSISSSSPAYLAGEWQVRSVDADGCKSELSVPVEIEITERPEAIATKSSDVCPGGSVQLFANEVEGATYTWSIAGNGTIVSTEQNPTITNLNNTTTYQLEIDNKGCRSSLASITVFAEAEPTANPNANYTLRPDCSPSNLTLQANANGNSNNYTYSWTGPNGFTSSAENPVIANASSDNNGAYELIITNEAGCTASFVTEVISTIEDEIAQPIITGSDATCRGGSVTLSVPQYSAADVNYRWRRNGTQILTASSNELIISDIQEEQTGVYTVTVGVNDCLLQSNEYVVTLNDQPEISPDFSLSNNCEGGVLTLNANPTSGQNLTYEWRGPNGFTSTAASTALNNTNVNQNGGYTLTAFAENGCSTTEEIFVDAINPSPAQPQVVGAEMICEGSDVRLQTANNYNEDVDYIWLNAFGQIISTDSVLTIDSDANEAVSPYRLRIEENGCFSAMSEPVEVTTVNAPTAIINANTSYCTGEDVQVFANSINGASYEWRHAFTNELLSTDQNPIFYNLMNDLPLELTVRVEGCTRVADASTRLEVNDPPVILQVVGNNEVCEGSLVTLSTSLSNGGGQDITYRWTGPNGFTFMETVTSGQPAALSLNNVTRSMAGSYTVTATAENGCESNTESILVNINTLPGVPNLRVSENVVCQNSTVQLDATPYTGSNNALYEWSYDDGTGSVLINVTSQPTLFLTNVTPSQSGNYSVRIQTGDCESASSNSVAIEIYGVQDAVQAVNTSSLEEPACAGDMVQLSVPFFAEATYQWYGPNGFTANVHNPVISPVSASSVGDYFAVLDLDGCATVVAQSTTVYVNPTPNAPTITSNANNGNAVCPDTDITLRVSSSLNFLPNDTLSFEWYDALTNELIGVTDTSVFELNNVSQTSDFYVVMTFNECTAVQSAPTTVNIIELPDNVFAFAGVDQELCANSMTTLSATAIEEGIGIWSSPTGATIFEPTSPDTEVADLQQGENIFVWSISTGFCGVAATDTVRVNVAELSNDIAVAGFDVNVCGENTAMLNATAPTTATGRWTQPDSQIGEGVKIVDPMNPQTQVTGLKEGADYTFTWSLSQGDCDDFQSDEVLVSVSPRPLSTAYIEKDEIYTCGNENVTILANTPQSASGRWTTDSGAMIIEAGSPSSLVTDLPMGASMFVWTLSNGACQSYSSDTLMVFSEPVPVAFPEGRNVEFNSDAIDIDVIANDELMNVEEFSIRITNFPDHGQVINNGDGTLTYQVDENYAGTDSLVYELCNANCEDLCSEATVSFNISGVDFANDCFIFNIMTPNGDGSNDALFVSCAEQFPNNEIKVFNRWGDKVFEASGYLNNWEATYQNKPLPAGTYYYLFKRDASFEAAEQGYITIFR